MWLISNLKKKLDKWLENHDFETAMAGELQLPVWRIALSPFINFYLLHWKWIWTTAITGIRHTPPFFNLHADNFHAMARHKICF